VVRGIKANWSAGEIEKSLLPAGRLDDVKLKELCSRRDLEEVADTLITWGHPMGEPLKKAVGLFGKDTEATAIELELYRAFYRQSLARLKGLGHSTGLMRDLMKREIDLLNLKAARLLKNKKDLDSASASGYYIPGGRLFTAKSFAGLFDRREGPKVLRSLKSTPYYSWLAGDRSNPEKTAELEQQHYNDLAGLYRRDPLGIDVVLGFLWQKYFEVVNLRMVGRGKFYGIPAEHIRNELIAVSPF
jgi:V/A-type H+-transporting ATPase subunit C